MAKPAPVQPRPGGARVAVHNAQLIVVHYWFSYAAGLRLLAQVSAPFGTLALSMWF